MRSLVVLALGSLVLVTSGCQPPIPTAPLRDAGPRDAFSVRDTGVPIDMGVELPDGGGVDANVIDPNTCRFVMAEDMVELFTDPRSRPSAIGLAGGIDDFAVAFSALGDDTFENLYFAEIPSSGALLVPTTQLTHDFATTTTPAVARTDTGWLLTWASNREATYDIFTMGFDADGRALAPVPLTMDGLTQSQPMLGRSGTTTLLAWDELDATATVHTTVLRTVGDDGAGTGAERRLTAAAFAPTPQVLASTDEGFVMGWGDATGDAAVMPLDLTGAMAGPPAGMSTLDDNDGTIDLAMSFGGGAAVYGARIPPGRSEVHAHLIDGSGAPIDVERALTVGLDSGTDASIAEFAGGYAISYRQAGAAPVLRVLFVDASLNEVARADIVPVSLLGGRTTIRASRDGSLVVAWADVADGATLIRAARIRCN